METKMIGNKIAEARKKIQISQALLAERLFISAQAVGKWERGESMPDIITFNRMAEILGVDLNYFSNSFNSVPVAANNGNPSEKQKRKPLKDMSLGNWTGADFSGLKNLHKKFSSANLKNCIFAGSELSGLQLKGNHVDGCDFSDSDLSVSQINNSYLANNNFRDCSLKETEFSKSFIRRCDFSGADFTGAVIKSGGFEKNTISGAILNGTSFIGTALAEIVFDGKIEDCIFENCAFSGVTFQNATLIDTFFKNKSLKRIRFIDCHADRITYAFLKNGKADLNGVELINNQF